jgi:hypothetical protein
MFIADLQASRRMRPGNLVLDLPTCFAESAAIGRAKFCEQGRDATFTQALPMWLGTVTPVALNDLRRVQGTPPFSLAMWNGLDQRIDLRNVVAVRAAQCDSGRFFSASMARIDERSTMARVTSISPRRRSLASSVSWIRCQRPAFGHAPSRRQQAVPEPQPISCGGRFHAMPARRTNTMPVSTAQSGVGFRPAYWRLRGARAGRSGSMSDHNASSTSCLGIASCQAKQDKKLHQVRKVSKP